MGIPICGGLHAVSTEDVCMDCQRVIIDRAMVAASEERNRLLEEQLELEHKGLRRPRREAPLLPPPTPWREKRSPSGGADVRPRHINTN